MKILEAAHESLASAGAPVVVAPPTEDREPREPAMANGNGSHAKNGKRAPHDFTLATHASRFSRNGGNGSAGTEESPAPGDVLPAALVDVAAPVGD